MGKLPDHVTRAEVAAALRLSLRQVDRLAAAGTLTKKKLGARRSGFDREEFDRYLKSIGEGEGYASPVGSFSFTLPPESPLTCNAVAAKLDEILATSLPGCLVNAADGAVHIVWNAALGYTTEQILQAV
ncbi:hypothetical protein [Hyphomicrobium sp. ghe19]|uniref:hypothetical protein n=1 Tax=Hyphomicrobium sp. ghe19 TaxID=2682968 RepID=UPI0013669E6F|nr:hypothetical protein HYPP_02397 [Hyphomicrobium sp. ghe19]